MKHTTKFFIQNGLTMMATGHIKSAVKNIAVKFESNKNQTI